MIGCCSACLYGGTCVDDVNGYHCLCAAGFTGSNCQHRINPCGSNPCLNDGRCSRGSEAELFDCSCQPGFTGRRCESFVDWCESSRSPCLNGGTCVQRSNQYHCLCSPEWNGLNCDVPRLTCAAIAADKGMSRSQAVARLADRTASQHLWGSHDVIGHLTI